MAQDYKLDPRFTRDVVRAPSNKSSSVEPPKVEKKYSREYIGAKRTEKYETRKSEDDSLNISGMTSAQFEPRMRPPQVMEKYSREKVKSVSDTFKYSDSRSSFDRFATYNGFMFEEYVIELFQAQGIVVMSTPASNDGGLDGVVYFEGKKFGLQVKKYKSNIGGEKIRTFIGSLKDSRLAFGIYVTTSSFSKRAIKSAERNKIILIDGSQLAEWRLNLKSMLRRV